ncbi:IS4 family transposase [Pseudoduganella chitinolytica]|uniref:IS4 family transposase n=1 Tax=Pseudoduganella chitinolytica TaxID=34070 RepID=A0ABY8BKX4_9BURK|nr:IS4 family transposase [Pseudoduganella chitinolytica]WEF31355.1 IS4 family transposase [Pseudoduganella chitinolytica]WEF31380.1 IS4 family transposase [Pseudoduganella chitinolytica]WEF32483.1 IS4 family transposase [Pseudoduganella chitinolytica]WEF35556.1 IS4 family transposase [Pseudoduganella chitinolytica]
MLDDALHFLVQAQEDPDWARLGRHLPSEWIEQAVVHTGKASIRRRRLPAEQVVWLVVALALYRHQSISEVVDDLDLALPDVQAPFVSKSAVAQARQRVGAEPLRALFEISAKAWSEQDRKQYLFKGLSLYAMDGTTLKTADTPEQRDHFGEQSYASGRIASYPQVRGVTLTAVPTHLIRDAKFGPYGINEMLYAKELLASIPDDSLTVFDKGFLSAEILCGLTVGGTNRHFIIPAKSNTKWEVVGGTADDAMIEMRVSPQARKKCPDLPETWRARAITIIDQSARKHVLLTSLCDTKRYTAKDVATCYTRRWQIETSYRELKQTMMGRALTLRSRTVEGVYQEIWGTLTAYNLIRLEIAKAALAVKCEPTEVSFIRAFHVIQYELHWAAVTRSHGKLPALMQRLRQRLLMLLNEERPGRKIDRAVKALPHRYTVRVLKKDLN